MKKISIITGVSGGIGETLAKKFLEDNFYVIGIDKEECKIDLGKDFSFYPCNLETIDKRFETELVNKIGSKCEKLILINNAAFQIVAPFEDITIEVWRKTFEINFFSSIKIIKTLIPHLSKAGGSIVNVSSIHTKLTKQNFSAYVASKSALEGITKSLAIELAGRNIRVNMISPAAIDTQMLKDGFHGKEKKLQELKAFHPANQIGSRKGVVDIIYNIAVSDDLFWTGSSINYDGGIGSVLSDPDNIFTSKF